MPLMMGGLYDALRQAQGVPEDAARKAAEEVASYEDRLGRVERDLAILKWMVGTNIALTLLVLGRLFIGG